MPRRRRVHPNRDAHRPPSTGCQETRASHGEAAVNENCRPAFQPLSSVPSSRDFKTETPDTCKPLSLPQKGQAEGHDDHTHHDAEDDGVLVSHLVSGWEELIQADEDHHAADRGQEVAQDLGSEQW